METESSHPPALQEERRQGGKAGNDGEEEKRGTGGARVGALYGIVGDEE